MNKPTILTLAFFSLTGCAENVDMVAPQEDLQIAEGRRPLHSRDGSQRRDHAN